MNVHTDVESVAKRDASWSFACTSPYCLPAKVIKWEQNSIHRHAGVRNNGAASGSEDIVRSVQETTVSKLLKTPAVKEVDGKK